MHWEARRKQVVLDRKFEYQDRIKRTQRSKRNEQFLLLYCRLMIEMQCILEKNADNSKADLNTKIFYVQPQRFFLDQRIKICRICTITSPAHIHRLLLEKLHVCYAFRKIILRDFPSLRYRLSVEIHSASKYYVETPKRV